MRTPLSESELNSIEPSISRGTFFIDFVVTELVRRLVITVWSLKADLAAANGELQQLRLFAAKHQQQQPGGTSCQ